MWDWALFFLGAGFITIMVLWVAFGVNPLRLFTSGMRGELDRALLPPPATPMPRPVVVLPPAAAPVSPPARLPLRDWFNKVNHEPDKTPHIAASGPSGSGKTTLILAALHDRPGRFVIVTPKSRRADPWGGLPVIRLRPEDMSFAPIEQAINAVYAEMLRRNAQDHAVEDDWLTLIIDEFSTVIGKLPDLREKVLDMVTLGRSSRIRMILLATETNVKAWGWEGRGEARGNVLFIECEEDTYSAVIYRWGKDRQAVDTSRLPQIAAQPLALARWWTPPAVSASETALQPWERAVSALECAVTSTADVSLPAVTPAEIAHIAAELTRGTPPSEIAKALPGYTPRNYTAFKAKVAYTQQLLARAPADTLADAA